MKPTFYLALLILILVETPLNGRKPDAHNETWVLTSLMDINLAKPVEIPEGEYLKLSFQGESCITINSRCKLVSILFQKEEDSGSAFYIDTEFTEILEDTCSDDFFSNDINDLFTDFYVIKQNDSILEIPTQQHVLIFKKGDLSQRSNCIDRCSIEPDKGWCPGKFKKYYYDQRKGRCKSFNWGGCGGTVPFDYLEDCQKKCGR